MNTKVLLAAFAGGVTTFLLGWLVYGIALKGFFDSNMGSATGVMRGEEDMQLWAIFAGNVAWALLLALLFSRWAGITTFVRWRHGRRLDQPSHGPGFRPDYVWHVKYFHACGHSR
ncbi:MAG: hypothetical protein IPK76_07995 [Lewinellaceae bacterium]|nr:hypothetical protein [Lewinellaceae bacterium]